MNTLHQAGDFVGIPRGARQVARFDSSRVITLKGVSLLIDIEHPAGRPRSLGSAIQRLSGLPPLDLQVSLLSPTQGQAPYQLKIRLSATAAIVWHTTVTAVQGGHAFTVLETSGEGGDFSPTQLGPGAWLVSAQRAGIGASGMTVVTRPVGSILVRDPNAPGPIPPPAARPSLDNVQSTGDGSFLVTGSRFVPGATVHIRVVDVVLNTIYLATTADHEGKFKDFPTGKICQRPGQLFFSANDGRPDPTEHFTGTLWSNTFTTTCPF